MSEISNAFEHFIVSLMKSDSHFLNKSDLCISTNSTCMYILTIVPILAIYIAQLIQRLEILHRNSPQSFSNQFLVICRCYLRETSQ